MTFSVSDCNVEVSDLLPIEDLEDSAVEGGSDSTVERREKGDERVRRETLWSASR